MMIGKNSNDGKGARAPLMALRGMIAALMVAAGSQACAETPAQDAVVAKLGDIELHASEVARLLQAQGIAPGAGEQPSLQALNRLVRVEVLRRAVLAEARAKSWDKRGDVVEQMERAREQVLLTNYINAMSRPAPQYPNADEVKAFYEANRNDLTLPGQFHIAQIFVALPENADAAAAQSAQQNVQELVRKLREKDADFAALARQYSEHKDSAASGGDMGWVTEAQLMPEIRPAVLALAKGGVSQPIRTGSGWHIIKLSETRPETVRPFEEVRDSLAQVLRQMKAQENEQKYFDDLLARVPLAVNELALAKFQNTPKAK